MKRLLEAFKSNPMGFILELAANLFIIYLLILAVIGFFKLFVVVLVILLVCWFVDKVV